MAFGPACEIVTQNYDVLIEAALRDAGFHPGQIKSYVMPLRRDVTMTARTYPRAFTTVNAHHQAEAVRGACSSGPTGQSPVILPRIGASGCGEPAYVVRVARIGH